MCHDLLLSEGRNLGLLAKLPLSLRAQVAVTTLLRISAASRLPEPSTRLALPRAMEAGATRWQALKGKWCCQPSLSLYWGCGPCGAGVRCGLARQVLHSRSRSIRQVADCTGVALGISPAMDSHQESRIEILVGKFGRDNYSNLSGTVHRSVWSSAL